jgi:polysaccharide biosynthesis protein PslH
VLDLDDLEHIKYVQEIRRARGGIQALKQLPYLVRYTYRDIILSRRFNTVLVCSPEDQNYLRRLGVANVRTVPNGTNFSPVARRAATPDTFRLAFVGNMGYRPNMDAVKFLTESILPRVRKHISDVQVDIIGRLPDSFEGLQHHVNFRGFVDDLPNCLSKYDLFVAPLRVGSGTKLKLVEAMAIGIPIVTTAVGARGLGLQHRHSAIIADTADSFATAILECHNDPGLANQIAINALAVAKQFRWDDIQQSVTGWLRQLANEQKR